MSSLLDLFAKLRFDTSEYDKGIEDAKGKASSISSTMKTVGAGVVAVGTAVVGVSTAFAKGMKDTAQYGDTIDKTSQKLGVSTDAYQKWDYVMNLAGTSMQNMGVGLKTLTKKLDDAKDGGEASQEAFAQLGISMEQIQSMSREELFEATIKGFQGMADSTERSALASELLGKSGQELIPLFNTSAEETEKLMNNLEQMGAVMSEDSVKASASFNDALTTMGVAIDGAKNGLMSDFLPSVTKAMEGLTQIISGDDSGLNKVNEGIDEFITKLSNSLPRIVDVAGRIVMSFAEAIMGNAGKIFEAGTQLVMMLADKIIENLPQLVSTALEIIVTLANGISQSLPELIPTIVDVVLEIVDTLIENVDMMIDGAIALIIGLANGLINALPKLIEKAPEIILKLLDALIRNAPKIGEAGLNLIKTLAKSLADNIPTLILEIPKLIYKMYQKFQELKSTFIDIGKNFVSGLWEGFRNNWSNFINNVLGSARELISKVQSVFKISSPSKVFKQIGAYCVEGFADGSDGMFSTEGMNAKITADVEGKSTGTDDVLALLESYLPAIAQGNKIVLDTGALVGSTAGMYNQALGKIAQRGVYV